MRMHALTTLCIVILGATASVNSKNSKSTRSSVPIQRTRTRSAPTSDASCYEENEHANKYLAKYPPSATKCNPGDCSFGEAKGYCDTLSDCTGVTKDKNGRYTVRAGTELKNSGTGEVSWEKKCYNLRTVQRGSSCRDDWIEYKDQTEDGGTCVTYDDLSTWLSDCSCACENNEHVSHCAGYDVGTWEGKNYCCYFGAVRTNNFFKNEGWTTYVKPAKTIKYNGGIITEIPGTHQMCQSQVGQQSHTNIGSLQACASMVKAGGWYYFAYVASQKRCMKATKCDKVAENRDWDWRIYSVTYDRTDFTRPKDAYHVYHNSECTGTKIGTFISGVPGHGLYRSTRECEDVCWREDECLGFTENQSGGMQSYWCTFYHGNLWKKGYNAHGVVKCHAKKQPCQCSGAKNHHGHGHAGCITTGNKNGLEWCYVSPWNTCPPRTVRGDEKMRWSAEACPNEGKNLCKCSGRRGPNHGHGGPECKVDGHGADAKNMYNTRLPWCYVGTHNSCQDNSGDGDNSWSEIACGVTYKTKPQGGWHQEWSYSSNVEQSHHCRAFHPKYLGFKKGCCTPEYPCPHMVGDCQKNADCLPGLKCVRKQGYGGYPPGTNICLRSGYTSMLTGQAQEATSLVSNLESLTSKAPEATLFSLAVVGFCVTLYYVCRALFQRKADYKPVEEI